MKYLGFVLSGLFAIGSIIAYITYPEHYAHAKLGYFSIISAIVFAIFIVDARLDKDR